MPLDEINNVSDAKSENNVVFELINISKSFPGVKALSEVNLKLMRGEIHALVGENGAGKSTAIKIICGVHKPDSGKMKMFGTDLYLKSPHDAFMHGINVVHQERNLVPTFSIAENILLEEFSKNSLGVIKKNKINNDAKKFMDRVGLNLDPSMNIEKCSAGQQQMIEIAKALSSGAKLILLDEPTASISISETEHLFNIVRNLQKQGVTFIYVSHKLEEIFAIADRVTVFRDGENAGSTTNIKDINRDKLISLMIGRSENIKVYRHRNLLDKEIVLETKDLQSRGSQKKKSFNLREGEILGWYGLVGAGRTEFARALIGSDPASRGSLLIKGKTVKILSVSDALNKNHMYYVSENRQEEGLFLMHSVAKNIASTVWNKLKSKIGLLSFRKENNLAEEYKEKLSIKTPSVAQLVSNLSGGNRQKICLAKGLATNPDILIIDEPTVGIDVNTKAEIHELIWKLSQEGVSIIVITSDLPELIQLVDRIIVFRDGEIAGDMENDQDYEIQSNLVMNLILQETKKSENKN